MAVQFGNTRVASIAVGPGRLGDLARLDAAGIGAIVVYAQDLMVAGDGLGGTYTWSATLLTDNGSTVIVPSSNPTNGCWVLGTANASTFFVGPRTHPSLAAIKVSQPPASGHDQRYVTGHTTDADGGGGSFVWVPGDTTTDDGGTVLASTYPGAPTGRWRRIFTGPLDARWFGAKCDSNGTHGNGTDDTAALTAWLAAIAASPIKSGIIMGLARTTAKLTLPQNAVIRGVGRNTGIFGDHIDHILESAGPINVNREGNVKLDNLILMSVPLNAGTISAITNANPPAVTCTAPHGLVVDSQGKDPIITIAGTAARGEGIVAFNSGSNTITRSVGSFLTDGFTVGMPVVARNTNSNNGYLGTVSAASAGSLTVTGTLVNESNVNLGGSEATLQGGMPEVIRSWRVHVTSPTTFTITNADATLWGHYVASSCGFTQSAYSGIHNLGSDFDAYDDIKVQGCQFGIIFDQSEVTVLKNFNGEGNSFAQLYYTWGPDVTAGASGGFTNNNIVINAQCNGGTFGLVHEGGSGFAMKGGNCNGQNANGAGARIGCLSYGTIDECDFETPAGLVIIGTSLLDGAATGGAGLALKRCTIATRPGAAIRCLVSSAMSIEQGQLASGHVPMIVGGVNFGILDIDEQTGLNGVAATIGHLIDHWPGSGNIAAKTNILQLLASAPDVSATTYFQKGAVTWNSDCEEGSPVGWVAPIAISGNYAGIPGQAPTWFPFGTVGRTLLETAQSTPNLIAAYTAERQLKINASTNCTKWRDISGNRDANFDLTATGGPPFVASDATASKHSTAGPFAVGKYFASGTFSTLLSQPITIMLIGYDDGINNAEYYCDGNDVTNRVAILKLSGNYQCFAGTSLSASSGISANLNVFIAVFNGASSKFFCNAKTPVTGNAGAQSLAGFAIGASYDRTTGLGGNVACSFIWDRALTTAECVTLLGSAKSTYPALTVGP